jgi:hypothetical protein
MQRTSRFAGQLGGNAAMQEIPVPANVTTRHGLH